MDDEHNHWDWGTSKVLIQLYQARPLLWDYQDEFYYNRFRKLKAWEEIGATMGRPVEACQRKMVNLLASFRREKARMNKMIQLGKCMYM